MIRSILKGFDSQKPLDAINIAFLALTPLIAVIGTAWYTYNYGVTRLELINFTFMFLATGIAMTAGYHRYYSHRTYECNKALELYYLIFGAAAVQNSVLAWCGDHRDHHRFVDKEEDPYNILKGGLYAHIGWVFFKDTRSDAARFKNIPDLMKNPLVRWQHKWYLPLVGITCFALPAFIGMLEGRPMGGLLWGGFLRVVFVHHMVFCINSVAHMVGSRPYTEDNSARDNWWLAPFTFGEGYHNFHHAFQADYRNGVRWYHFDMAKWFINSMASIGWATRLRRVSDYAILAARVRMEMLHVEKKLELASASDRMWEKVQFRLDAGRLRLETAMTQYHEARLEYRRQKDQWSAETRKQWAEKMAEYQDEFDAAKTRWRETVRSFSRIATPA